MLNIVLHAAGLVLGVCTGAKHGKALWNAGKEAINKRKEENVQEETTDTTEE